MHDLGPCLDDAFVPLYYLFGNVLGNGFGPPLPVLVSVVHRKHSRRSYTLPSRVRCSQTFRVACALLLRCHTSCASLFITSVHKRLGQIPFSPAAAIRPPASALDCRLCE